MRRINRIKILPGMVFGGKDFSFKQALKDPTARSLILSNLILLILAVIEHLPFINLMWAYFLQSLIIGVFVFIKIIVFGNITQGNKIRIEGGREGGRKIFNIPGWTIQFGIALFFAFHYGFFHFIYGFFLMSFDKGYINKEEILMGAGIFFLNHLYSFLANYHNDKANMPKVGYLMASAYTRIIPMYIIIMVGGIFWGFTFTFLNIPVLILFIALKTYFDVKMHTVTHKGKQGATLGSVGGVVGK
ncbi:MAG: DUF6498-containing protein [Candidatus Gribaldobacteria bacterium]|nr:DUF6498-containing protein [Candidatus Gribaldobacteria bacterium]